MVRRVQEGGVCVGVNLEGKRGVGMRSVENVVVGVAECEEGCLALGGKGGGVRGVHIRGVHILEPGLKPRLDACTRSFVLSV